MVERMVKDLEVVTVYDIVYMDVILITLGIVLGILLLRKVLQLNGEVSYTGKDKIRDIAEKSYGKRETTVIRNWMIYIITILVFINVVSMPSSYEVVKAGSNEEKVVEYLVKHKDEVIEYRQEEEYDTELKELLSVYKKYTKVVGLENIDKNEEFQKLLKEVEQDLN